MDLAEVVADGFHDIVWVIHILHNLILLQLLGDLGQRVGVGVRRCHADDDGGIERIRDDLRVVVADNLLGVLRIFFFG